MSHTANGKEENLKNKRVLLYHLINAYEFIYDLLISWSAAICSGIPVCNSEVLFIFTLTFNKADGLSRIFICKNGFAELFFHPFQKHCEYEFQCCISLNATKHLHMHYFRSFIGHIMNMLLVCFRSDQVL